MDSFSNLKICNIPKFKSLRFLNFLIYKSVTFLNLNLDDSFIQIYKIHKFSSIWILNLNEYKWNWRTMELNYITQFNFYWFILSDFMFWNHSDSSYEA